MALKERNYKLNKEQKPQKSFDLLRKLLRLNGFCKTTLADSLTQAGSSKDSKRERTFRYADKDGN